jgi:hypothetical protein
MTQRTDLSAPHKFVGVAAREAENLCDFNHRKKTLGVGGLILVPLLLNARQARGGKSAKHGRATSNQEASYRF